MPIRLKEHCVAVLVLLLTAGCQRAGLESKKSNGDNDFFASPGLLDLAIEIVPAELDTLRNNPNSHAYVRCSVREGSQVWEAVGLRCRGNPAKELSSGRPDLIVTFDKFKSGQKFHGQKRMILQASRDDASCLSAPIAFDMFREAGVPAARYSFARIKLNESEAGLYVLIEGVDRAFLKRHFRQTSGNLYDPGEASDVTGKLEKDRGRDDNDQSDVDALAAASLQADAAERWEQLEGLLDMDRFLAFIALEILLWQDNSYSLEAAKFRIYHDPGTDRMVFFPKNVEKVLAKTNGPVFPKCKGVVAHAVLTTTQGEEQFRKTVARLLQTVFNPDKVESRTRELAALTRPASPGGDAAQAFDAAMEKFLDAVRKRADFVAHQLKIPSPSTVASP